MIFATSDNQDCNLHPRLQVTYTLSVSVEELSSNLFSIYPNPADGSFSIKFNSDETSFDKLEIVNSIGQVIMEEKISDQLSKTEIDVKDVAKGFYEVILESEKGRAVNKLLIN
jgi:hypothetical protein